ncbi:MAG: hypothetical protein R3F11_04370 [Verrucomicrobiales bacterium]
MLGDDRYLDAARRTGEFLIRAQMPDLQPAWAQAYDAATPGLGPRLRAARHHLARIVSNFKSLLELFRATGDRRFLAPVPKALDYLRNRTPDGQLSRFYELRTTARSILLPAGEGGNGWALGPTRTTISPATTALRSNPKSMPSAANMSGSAATPTLRIARRPAKGNPPDHRRAGASAEPGRRTARSATPMARRSL